MPDLVVTRHRAVTKAARRARKSDLASDFHRLRIKCKKLRYALEFSSDIYGGQTAKFVRQLVSLQDQLGLMQDSEVAANRLADLATGEAHLPAATVFVMGAVAERHHRTVRRLLKRLPEQARDVKSPEWQELLEVMERSRADAAAEQPSARRDLRPVPAPRQDQTTPDTHGRANGARPSRNRAPNLKALNQSPSGQAE
jgi:CHAD domain-containing protein